MSMSLKCKPIEPIPVDTQRLGELLLASTDLYRLIGEQLTDFVCDSDFIDLYADEGKPAESPALLAMVTVFQFMENLSDRQAAAMVVKRMDWKYALHLALTDPGFNYSVLCEFRQRLLRHHQETLVFERLLNKLKTLGLVKARGVQRTDALAVLGAVTRLNRLELVCETLRKVLNDIARVDPRWLQQTVPQTFIERYSERAEAERLVTETGTKADAQVQRLAQQAGQDGYWLLQRLDAADVPVSLKTLPTLKTLRTVWEQHFKVRSEVTSAQPITVEFRAQPAGEGADLIPTPHDPQVRYSEKRGQEWVGYKVQVTETSEPDLPRVITDIRTTSATTPDEQQVEPIQQTLTTRQLLPAQHVVDMAYVSGSSIATSATHGIELIGPARPDTSAQARMEGGITLSQFEINETQHYACCPQGHRSVVWSVGTQRGKPVVRIRFAAQTCAPCPLYDRCIMRHKQKPVGRTLKVLAYHAQVCEQRRKQTTAPFKALYRRRSGVEATLSLLVRRHGVRRARYVGMAKTHLQHQFIGTACNLKHCATWLAGARSKARGRSTVGLKKIVAANLGTTIQ
jgi:transposase